jgi:hypothetical protein
MSKQRILWVNAFNVYRCQLVSHKIIKRLLRVEVQKEQLWIRILLSG